MPAKVHVLGDLRYISAKQESKTREKMRRIVAKSLPHASARIDFIEGPR